MTAPDASRQPASVLTPLLTVEDLDVAYGDFQVLWQAAMHVGDGEIVAVLGPNGAGKSTLMNTISGLITPRAGRITFGGTRIDGLPAHRTAGEGLAHVLERRRLFPFLTVLDNVVLGAHNPAARPHRDETLALVQRLFPVIAERRGQLAHTLSGGEQQMVAIARGLMARPRLLMIDEPFLGLAPMVVQTIGGLIRLSCFVQVRARRGWRPGRGGGAAGGRPWRQRPRSRGGATHDVSVTASQPAGSDLRVVVADWGDAVGPTLDDILVATPGVGSGTVRPRAATQERGMSRLVQGAAAGIIALQYLNVTAPKRLRVWATDELLRRRGALMQE